MNVELTFNKAKMGVFTFFLYIVIASHTFSTTLAHGICRNKNICYTRSTRKMTSAFSWSNKSGTLGSQQLIISRGGDGFSDQSATNLSRSMSEESPVTRNMVMESASGSLSAFAGVLSVSKLAPITSTFFATVSNFYRNYPFLSGFLTCAFKASIADIVAQKQFGQLDEDTTSSSGVKFTLNKQRTLAFFFYGGLFQGCILELMFNHVLPYWFGTGTDPVTVASKALFDIILFGPLVTLPVAYLAKACIFRYGVGEALRRYWHDVTVHKLVFKFGLFWGPVNCLVFSVIPPHFRIAFVALMSFFWMIVLSYTSNKSDVAAAAAAAVLNQKDDGADFDIDGGTAVAAASSNR